MASLALPRLVTDRTWTVISAPGASLWRVKPFSAFLRSAPRFHSTDNFQSFGRDECAITIARQNWKAFSKNTWKKALFSGKILFISFRAQFLKAFSESTTKFYFAPKVLEKLFPENTLKFDMCITFSGKRFLKNAYFIGKRHLFCVAQFTPKCG